MKKWQDFSKTEQKNIEMAVLSVVFLGITFGLYSPSYNELKSVKEDSKAINEEIDRIELLVGKNRDIKQGLRDFQEQIRQFHLRFPEKEEQGLKALADTARKNQLDIISTRIGSKRKSTDKKNKALTFSGRTCSLTPVAIQLKGRFQDCVTYLEDLTRDPAYFVTVERLNLDRADAVSGILSITIDLNLYLLG